MHLADAERMARELMERWQCDGWEFRWSNSKLRFGQVSRIRNLYYGTVSSQTLSLSRPLTKVNTEDEVRDTILHEIAHIKAGLEHKHGPEWRKWCRIVGCRPEQYCGDYVERAQHKWELKCSCCQQVLRKFYRRPRKNRSFAYCLRCGPDSLGKLKLLAVGEPHEV